jgi:hypothetical protein
MRLLVCEEHFQHPCDIVANEHNSNTSLMPKNIKLQKPIMSYNLEFFVNCLGLQNAVAIAKLWGHIKIYIFACRGFIIPYQVNPSKKY